MGRGFRSILIGYLTLCVHFTYEGFQILPTFLSWLIIVYGTFRLSKIVTDNEYKMPLLCAFTLVLFSVVTGYIFNDLKMTASIILNIVQEFMELIYVYFLFQGTIQYLKTHRLLDIANKVSIRSKTYVILQGGSIVLGWTAIACKFASIGSTALIMLLVLKIYLLYLLFSLILVFRDNRLM